MSSRNSKKTPPQCKKIIFFASVAFLSIINLFVVIPAVEVSAHNFAESVLILLVHPAALFFLWLMFLIPGKWSSVSLSIASFFLILLLTLSFIGLHSQQTAIRDLNLGVPYVEGTAQRLVFGAVYTPLSWGLSLFLSFILRKKNGWKTQTNQNAAGQA